MLELEAHCVQQLLIEKCSFKNAHSVTFVMFLKSRFLMIAMSYVSFCRLSAFHS